MSPSDLIDALPYIDPLSAVEKEQVRQGTGPSTLGLHQ